LQGKKGAKLYKGRKQLKGPLGGQLAGQGQLGRSPQGKVLFKKRMAGEIRKNSYG